MKRIIMTAVVITTLLASLSNAFAGGQQEAGPESSGGTEVAGQASVDASAPMETPDWLVENTDDHIIVIDSYGNQVTIEKPVKSLVSTGMGQAFAALKAMKAENMVSAVNGYVTRNKVFFPELSKLPTITVAKGSVNNEMILQLAPDFILTEPSVLPLFSEVVTDEIPVVQLNFNSTEAYSILGALLGKETEAKQFTDWIRGYTDTIDERISALSENEYQDVFIYYGGESGMATPPPYGTFGKDNFLRNELITRAGGKSLASDLNGEWITVDPEWVIEQNPPVIIRECYIINDHPELGYSVATDSYAQALMTSILGEQPAFEVCDAVKDKRVHLIYGDLTEDSWFISLVYMAKWLHPELFADLDPVKMHQEYISRFERLDFDVTKQGLFTYSAE